ncbi:cation-translocating P-type ATPase [Adlercreutzia equolifaciens]|uniref:heavy metal translocating P-type ATPase n=1 Tax=Adlercreutzia equolifaciens TaxID=446660 RepID=UPI0023AEF599|nr:cation-translocating P-type ATPase [Adlercreutzia equolifaciens]MDE8701588.1 cation-translocating P-type ATPase [Adlercreutzia equolifaciens]
MAVKQHIDDICERVEEAMEVGGIKKSIAFLIVSGLALVVSLVAPQSFPVDPAWIAIILCGVPIVVGAIIGLVTEFDIKADVLVSIALIAAIAIGEDFAAGEVAFIMQIGALLEEITVERARAGIERLIDLAPRTARVLVDGEERILDALEVKIGDALRILPGETIPVDGIITRGQTAVDQSVMTGEPMPVDKAEGDEVSSGTVNQLGSFDMTATRVGEDSSIQRMVRLVQSADADKAKVVRVADRWATWIVVAALTAALITWLVTGEILRAVTILVVFCPCALVLATPTAIMAAIGNATKHNFLTREGDALERMARVTQVAFDKTGTLTYGAPQIVGVRAVGHGWTDEQLFEVAARAESRSEHPLGRAIVASWQKAHPNGALGAVAAESFQLLLGRGVSAEVDNRQVLVVNRAGLDERGVTVPEPVTRTAEEAEADGCTVVYVAVDGELAGYLALADQLRAEAPAMIAALKEQGLVPVLLTGDNERAAAAIARTLGIQEVHAHCLPEDKIRLIDAYEKEGKLTCMVGDGVNDAPALKRAYVSVAMGGVGSDIAVDAADIALINDDIAELPHLTALGRHTMRTITANLTFAMTVNLVATLLAILGLMGPVVGALVHNVGSVLVIGNSALLLKWRKHK